MVAVGALCVAIFLYYVKKPIPKSLFKTIVEQVSLVRWTYMGEEGTGYYNAKIIGKPLIEGQFLDVNLKDMNGSFELKRVVLDDIQFIPTLNAAAGGELVIICKKDRHNHPHQWSVPKEIKDRLKIMDETKRELEVKAMEEIKEKATFMQKIKSSSQPFASFEDKYGMMPGEK